MRRLMLMLMGATFLASMAGCCGDGFGCGSSRGHSGISQGMCDCETDDHCLERAPWLHYGGAAPAGEVIKTPPAKMPDGRPL